MASNEQSIRVTARGEFSQLENGLKNLQKDLKGVLGEIDKGARRGGFFDDTQLRALDVYRTRFKSTMDELNKEFQKQNSTIDQLYKQQSNASKDMQRQIQAEIDRREKLLDRIRKQMMATEDLYGKRTRESNSYQQPEPSTRSGRNGKPSREEYQDEERHRTRGSGAGGGSSLGSSISSSIMGGGGAMLGGSVLSKILGIGGFLMGLAGISGIASTAMQSYQLAYNSQVTPMDLSQRLRGSSAYGGTAKNMWDTMGAIGRSDQMGYTSQESWNFQDSMSRSVGAQNPYEMGYGLKFGRAYGLDTNETSQGLSGIIKQGGGSTSQVADMVASSVAQSGMTPRILEVMQTSAGLLASMNTTLKDNGAKQILAYQTTLDTIGNTKGMQQLTGEKGANIIQGLGGIFNPSQSNPWQWMGIQALQQYNPKKYGKMGLYDLQSSFEDGLVNTDNLPAMAQYIKKQSGGNVNTTKRMLQKWLQDGGYNATKTQVSDLYSATDGLSAFDSKKVNGIIGQMNNGDGTAKYQERMGQIGQNILDTNARFEKQLENLGQPLLTIVQGMKESVTKILEDLTSSNGLSDAMNKTLSDIKKFMDDHLVGLATAAGLIALAPALSKLIPKLGGGGGGKGGSGGSGGGSTIIGTTKNVAGTALIADIVASVINASGDPSKDDAMAKKAGLGKTNWFDRFFVNILDGGGLFGDKFKQGEYNALNTKKSLSPMDKWLHDNMPGWNAPESKEQQSAIKNVANGKTADGKNTGMAWYQYADPSNWGKIDWQKMWDKFWGKNVPNKDQLTKDGLIKTNANYIDPQKAAQAITSLKNLGDGGKVDITNLTSQGEAKLKELADKGLISIKAGQDVQVTQLTGFSNSGKSDLLKLQKDGLISIGGFSTDGSAKVTALSSEGQKRLEELKKSGSIDISNFHTESTKQITSLSQDGAQNLLDLLNSGSISLSSMDGTTSDKLEKVRKNSGDKMDDIKAIHTSWSDGIIGKDGILTKWADAAGKAISGFFDWWKKILPSWLGGGQGSGDIGTNPFTTGGGGQAMPAGVSKYKSQLAAAGAKYGISDTNLLMAMMSQESGGQGNNPMQVNGATNPSQSIDEGVKMMADLLKRTNGDVGMALQAYNMGSGYIDFANSHGGNTPANAQAFSNKEKSIYGSSVYGDPSYVAHVMRYYPKTAGAGGGGGNAFANWQNHVTSPFGATDGRSTPHGGLDIGMAQGTALQAIAGGKVSFIKLDPNNKTAGGNELGVKMGNGETYYYAHLSGGINPQILKDYQAGKMDDITAGEWIANSGGTPGLAGTGNDSTGAHLHVGYMGANGVLKDPAGLLRRLGVANGFGNGSGDGDVGINPMVSGSSVSKIEVTVNLQGSGASELNTMTQSTLRKMIQDAIKNYEAQKLLLNPSM